MTRYGVAPRAWPSPQASAISWQAIPVEHSLQEYGQRALAALRTQFEVAERQGKPVDQIAFRAVMAAIDAEIPVPDWASRVVLEGWTRFLTFEVESLGDAFGFKAHKHRAAKRDRLYAFEALGHIEKLREEGHTLDRALELTAAEFSKSVAWLRAVRSEAKKEKEK